MSYIILTRTLLALSFLAPLQAANLTGHWLFAQHRPDGQVRETSLYLTANGDNVTGYLDQFNQDPVEINSAKLAGSDLTFSTVRDYYGEQHTSNFSATVNGEDLVLHMPGPNGSTRDITLKRVSSEVPGPMPAAKPKITLPPAREVRYDGLAKTPPMGWNSWNKFASKVTDKLVRETADAMASNGMKAAGYQYINIDDTWEAGRDAQGNIQTNDKFPDMKALADYIHSKGLKLGIYSSPGPKTCAGYEGSFGHEEQDAKTYAKWAIDYLKYDWCSASRVYDYHSMQAAYAKMGQALLESGRPIVYSLCQYGLLHSSEWGPKVGGNLWRTTGDIRDSWDSMSHIGFDLQLPLTQYANPGHWNDPDMLEIGNGGMTDTEYRTHMSLWSLLAAPLLAGNDLRAVPPETMAILANKEVIAIDQDALGKEATRIAKEGDSEIWARPLADGGYAVGLFNRGPEPAKITTKWSDLGITRAVSVRDLWKHSDEGDSTISLTADVASHGVTLLRIKAVR
jgi:alpha-galactosidase